MIPIFKSEVLKFCGFICMGFVLALCPMLDAEVFGETDAPTSIRIATPEWDKSTMKDGNGVFFELLREIYAPSGIELTYRFVPFKRALFMVDAGEADAVPACYYEPKHEKTSYFPLYPIGTDEMGVFFVREKIGKWEGRESMAGKRLLSLRGYNMDSYLDVPVTYWEIDRTEQGINLVKAGRHDFYMDDRFTLDDYVREHNIDTNVYGVETVVRRYTYLRFNQSEKSKALIQIYDRRYPELLKSGFTEKLWRKYGFSPSEMPPREERYAWEK